jgi:nanoRNase/pAp phosphatase (c-di-AMP/oligoRNAs hydrolase)
MKHQFDIIIDHHRAVPLSKASFVDIKENYGAASTIMTEYLRAAKIKPSPRLATALFYGIKTDTNNFVRESLPNDINAFRYLYQFANMQIIKKIESSEITHETLDSYRQAMERLTIVKDTAFVHLGEVDNPDVLVIIADFFLRLADATWSVVTGTFEGKLVAILRNGGFRGDAGKVAQKLFEVWGGSGGGHRSAARAEMEMQAISESERRKVDPGRMVLERLKDLI